MSIIYINPYQFAAAGPTDPNFANVSLLLHGDGTNGSTTIVDSSPSPKTVTAFGDAQISTAQSKFGGASIAFDGAGDYLKSPISSDYEFGTGDFTVEAWVRFVSISAEQRIVGIGRGALGVGNPIYTGWSVRYSTGKLAFYRFDGSETDVNRAWSPVVNTWYHVAVSRNGTSLRLFADGNQLGATHTSTLSYNRVNNEDIEVGQIITGAGTFYFNGYIDDLRITKGVARYTANFTPPTAPFPDA